MYPAPYPTTSTHWAVQGRLASIAVGIVVSTTIILLVIRNAVRKRHIAPGPSGLPILGNIFQLPANLQFIRLAEWAQEYGPVYSLNLLGQPVLVVNNHQVATDLLERRSSIYSDRPRTVMVNEILTQGMDFMRYGDRWRRVRRASHSNFNATAAKKFEPFQAKSAIQGALRMLARPDEWEDHLNVLTVSTLFTSVYGRPIEPEPPMIARAKAHIDRIAQDATPGRYLCEFLPIMKVIPSCMAAWKRDALEWHENETLLFEELATGSDGDAAIHSNSSGFAADLLEVDGKYGLTRKEACWLAGGMLGVGADTTAVALSNFVLAMVHYPEVMRKAQAELDDVIGRSRPPSFHDIAGLPYIQAVVKETLRWRPVAPLAAMHRVIEVWNLCGWLATLLTSLFKDDWYGGHLIPKGTTIIANLWHMNRDPRLYPDFDTYRPERFIDDTDKNNAIFTDTHQLGHVTYGFGRRNCVGQSFANQSLFITIATMLWALDFSPAVDEDGEPIMPPLDEWVDEGIVVRPKHFECQIVARFPDAKAILEACATEI
ncbi:cytochrome P450 [Irpex lacteus]|nr:cytochrome P450 [Irpex lacteus]